MSDERILSTLRLQAWERAKGELNSMLQSYWGFDGKFESMDEAVTDFIEKVESEGWQE